MQDLALQPETWIDLTTQFGLTPGQQAIVQNTGSNVIRVETSVAAPAANDSGLTLTELRSATASPQAGEKIWAFVPGKTEGRIVRATTVILSGGSSGGSAPIPVGVNGIGVYDYKETVAAPASGEIRFNNVNPALATEIRIHKTRKDGADNTSILESLAGIDSVLFIDSVLASDQCVTMIIETVVDNTTYFTYTFSNPVVCPTELADSTEVFGLVGQSVITPADAVDLVNQGLSNVWWQQGISNAIFVRDLSEDSPELAPYLDVDGKWHLPDDAILVIDVAALGAGSVLERTIVADGNLFIAPSIQGGGIKGISMANGVGEVEMNAAIESTGQGTIIFGDLVLSSDDLTRSFFDIQDITNFVYVGTLFFMAIPGTINADNIRIENATALAQISPLVVGANCSKLKLVNVTSGTGFLGIQSDFIDLRITPTSGSRKWDIQNCGGNVNDNGEAIFLIEQDNGENIGSFENCELDTVGGLGTWIRAANDAVFNDNPDKSLYLDFDVENFIKTQRLGECYLTVTAATTGSATPQDLAGTFSDGGLTSGLIQISDDEYEWGLDTPTNLKCTVELQATDTNQATWFMQGFFKPALGAYSPLLKAGTQAGSQKTISNSNPRVDFIYNFIVRMNKGDRIRQRISRTVGTGNVTIQSGSVLFEVI